MRSRAELDAIRDEVVAYVRDHPPTEPLLTELYPEPSPPKTPTCKQGHVRTPGRKCPTCADAIDAVRARVWPGLDEGEGY